MDISNDQRKALTHYLSLEQKLENLFSALRNGESDRSQLCSAVAIAQSDAHGIGAFLRSSVAPVYYNEIREEDSTIAVHVFKVPELLETILGYLEIPDILSFYQTSKSGRDIITTSIRLQQTLSLTVSGSSKNKYFPLATCLANKPGRFCCPSPTSPGPHGLTAEFCIGPDNRLPSVGERYRQMFIFQPPPKKMKVFVGSSAGRNSPNFRHLDDVENPSGLTIGDLLDATGRAIERYTSEEYKMSQYWHARAHIEIAARGGFAVWLCTIKKSKKQDTDAH